MPGGAVVPSGFEWVISPDDELIPNIQEYGRAVYVALHAIATYWGQLIQDKARLEAVWTDQTGNARGGLFFAVDGFGLAPVTGTVTAESEAQKDDVTIESGDANTLIITLGHTVFYGKFLELSNAGDFAIIMSTIEGNLSSLEKMIKDTLS